MNLREGSFLTNVVRLDLDALLDMCHLGVVGLSLGDNVGIAQSVDEGGATKTGSACEFGCITSLTTQKTMVSGTFHATKVVSSKDEGDDQDENIPTTIKVNWNPFLTFFLRPMRYMGEDKVKKNKQKCEWVCMWRAFHGVLA